jgi:hypothetical protein
MSSGEMATTKVKLNESPREMTKVKTASIGDLEEANIQIEDKSSNDSATLFKPSALEKPIFTLIYGASWCM